MRRAQMEDLQVITDFIVDRFWGLEHFNFLSQDLATPKETLTALVTAQTAIFLKYGDIYLYQDPLLGAIAGIPLKKFSLPHQLFYSLATPNPFRKMPRLEQKLLLEKNKLITEIHTRWHKKYTKNAYYLCQVAVAKEAKGTGVLRKMLTPILIECQTKGQDIVLETMTESNIPIYQHFGFELVETHHSPNVPYDEYCFIRRHK
ncbi:GNAT family N-acetyltransferase [Enterococcus sp. AZ072]|uniref:GNAT family N-acetyltransferase n=1 Tax=unclassified Enterococcus TaxID=2608891 RepID=UPI003D28BCBF